MIRFAIIVAWFSTSALAQNAAPGVMLAHTERRAITSDKIGQRYELLVSLPDDYGSSSSLSRVTNAMSDASGRRTKC